MGKRNVHGTLYGKTSLATVMVMFAALLLAGCGGRSEPASGGAAPKSLAGSAKEVAVTG